MINAAKIVTKLKIQQENKLFFYDVAYPSSFNKLFLKKLVFYFLFKSLILIYYFPHFFIQTLFFFLIMCHMFEPNRLIKYTIDILNNLTTYFLRLF